MNIVVLLRKYYFPYVLPNIGDLILKATQTLCHSSFLVLLPLLIFATYC